MALDMINCDLRRSKVGTLSKSLNLQFVKALEGDLDWLKLKLNSTFEGFRWLLERTKDIIL